MAARYDEHNHRNLQGGGARAAVFGVSDGLVTNVSLILGVAGAHPAPGVVRLSGLAGLVAGAFSMAAGEYVSMRTQRELFQRELELERQAISGTPKEEAEELKAIYEERGIDPVLAKSLVKEVMGNPELALETHAREELGIDPTRLGNPVQAAVSSFLAFAIGAILPLAPWLITGGTTAIVSSIAVGAVAAVSVGWIVGMLTGRSRLRSAVRQFLVSGVAASVTFGVGHLVGVVNH
ncbi:MAG: VIT1/CCC1 transporter family protein [Acidimicrobiales bacterium]